MNLSSFTVFLKNKNFTSKIKRAKVTDYAALRNSGRFFLDIKMWYLLVSKKTEFIICEWINSIIYALGLLSSHGKRQGGYSNFSAYVGSDPASTVHLQKISEISSTPKIYLKILQPQKISRLCIFTLRKDPKIHRNNP